MCAPFLAALRLCRMFVWGHFKLGLHSVLTGFFFFFFRLALYVVGFQLALYGLVSVFFFRRLGLLLLHYGVCHAVRFCS